MTGQRIGYRRVSTTDQNSARQLDGVALDRIFEDHASGRDTARPGLDALLDFIREGDTLVVHSLDRLARNLDDLRRLVGDLTADGIRVEFVKEGLLCFCSPKIDHPCALKIDQGWIAGCH